MRSGAQLAPVTRPGSSTVRSRDNVTRRLRPAATASRSGHIRSMRRSRRSGPARTRSSSNERTRRRRSSATSTALVADGDLQLARARRSSPSGSAGSGRASSSTVAPALSGVVAVARGVLQLGVHRRRGEVGEPDGESPATRTPGGDGSAGELDGPRQRERREHRRGVGEVMVSDRAARRVPPTGRRRSSAGAPGSARVGASCQRARTRSSLT